jgi:glycosyltransferase involved in cell wall biosynthesis
MNDAVAERSPGPLVSIVLPTYNGSRYIGESIESVLAQTYVNWELIIVDDASTDDTPEKVVTYARADQRIRVIRHETNRHLPAALNTGFSHACGELFTWTSDDNLYRANALETMVARIEHHPDVGLVYSDYSIIDDQGIVERHVPVADAQGLAFRNILGPSFLYRQRVAAAVGRHWEQAVLAEDYDYWLRVAARFAIAPVHEDLYCYRVHRSSLTSSFPGRAEEKADAILMRRLPHLPFCSPSTKCEAFWELARHARRRGQRALAVRLLVNAYAAAPRRCARILTCGIWKAVRRRLSVVAKALARPLAA